MRTEMSRSICVLLLFVTMMGGGVFGYVPNESGGDPSGFDPLSGLGGHKGGVRGVHAGGVRDGGGFGFSYDFGGLSSLLGVSLGMGYESGGRFDLECGFGWRLQGVLEIVKASEAAYQNNYGGGGVYLLRGPLSGVLDFDSGRGVYELRSAAGGVVEGKKVSGGWVVSTASGVVYELGEHPVGSERFRVDVMRDMVGNVVEFSYATDGRLEFVRFGGNNGVGEQAEGLFELVYVDRDRSYVSGGYGLVEEWSKVLSEVRLYAVNGSSSRGTLVQKDVLDLDQDGAVVLVRGVERFGYREDGSEDVGLKRVFDYSEVGVRGVDGERLSETGVGSLVMQRTFVEDGYSWVTRSVVDFNGDGLVDVVSVDGTGGWSVVHQLVDTNGVHSFSKSAYKFSGPGVDMEEWAPSSGGQLQLVGLEDVDGDGFLDVVSVMEKALADGKKDFGDGLLSGFKVPKSSTWGVFYGDGKGFSSRVWEVAPVSYLRLDQSGPSGSAGYGDRMQELMDVDGDGWLDVVRASPASTDLMVYFHLGARGAGWSAVGVRVSAPWLGDFSDPTLRGLSQSSFTMNADGFGRQYVDQKWGWGGFLDVNGDGLLDYVICGIDVGRVGCETDKLAVYYGLGSGRGWSEQRTMGGNVDVLSYRDMGGSWGTFSPARTEAGFYDVDGDGLLDYVDAGGWRRNEGDRIDLSVRPLPSRLSGGVFSKSVVGGSMEWSRLRVKRVERIEHETVLMVMDLDCDGVNDVVDGEPSSSWVGYGEYPRPYVMKELQVEGGLKELIAYAPSSRTYPRGTTAACTLGIRQDVVEEVTTVDQVTGHQVETKYEYEYGEEERGIFKGYENRRKTEVSWVDIDGSRSKRQVVIEEDYDLSSAIKYGSSVLAATRIYTDAHRQYAPSFWDGATFELNTLEQATKTEHNVYGNHYLADKVSVSRYGETGAFSMSGPETLVVEIDYDAQGNVLEVRADGGDGYAEDENDKRSTYSYVKGSDGVLTRLAQSASYSWDPLSKLWRKQRGVEYLYDGHTTSSDAPTVGLLTEKIYQSGNYYDTGTIEDQTVHVQFTRGARGEITSIARGQNYADYQTICSNEYTFGRAVLSKSINALGHEISHTIDGRGRVVETEDANGVVQSTEYDGLNRVLATYITDATGVKKQTGEQSYHLKVTPAYTVQKTYNDSGIEQSVYTYTDAKGQPYQTHHLAPDGSDWILQDSEYDLYGNSIWSGHPYRSGTPGQHQTKPSYFGITYYDSLNRPRESTRDYANGLNTALVNLDKPLEETEQDEEGYERTIHYDIYGRILRVEQGQDIVGNYQYDGQDQLIIYTDANANQVRYRYDAIGRLIQSQSPDIGTVTRTYTYNTITESRNSAGDWIQTQYDLLDRPTNITLSNPLEGTLTYTSIYDQNWIGTLAEQADPYGSITHEYDALGRLTNQARTFNMGSSIIRVARTQTLDLLGRTLQQTTPSGKTLTHQWSYGHLQSTTLDDGTILSYQYDDYGHPTQRTNTLGHQHTTQYQDTPHHISHIDLKTPKYIAGKKYQWYDNGLLQSQHNNAGGFLSAADAQKYKYDDKLQLIEIDRSNLKGLYSPYEIFTHDNNGNLLTRQDETGTNHTYKLGIGNQLATHKQTSGTETYSYDKAGRLQQKTNGRQTYQYTYNGAGKLVEIKKNGNTLVTYHYGPNGELVQQGNNSGHYTLYFGTWRQETASGKQTENLGSFAYENGIRKWCYRGYDGTVLATFDDSGNNLGANRYSAYGKRIVEIGTSWDQNAYQGSEYEPTAELYHLGQRHMNPQEGQWLQPEPYLAAGLNLVTLKDPLQFNPYRYVRNNPAILTDKTGWDPECNIDDPNNPINAGGTCTVTDHSSDKTMEMLGTAYSQGRLTGHTTPVTPESLRAYGALGIAVCASGKIGYMIIPEARRHPVLEDYAIGHEKFHVKDYATYYKGICDNKTSTEAVQIWSAPNDQVGAIAIKAAECRAYTDSYERHKVLMQSMSGSERELLVRLLKNDQDMMNQYCAPASYTFAPSEGASATQPVPAPASARQNYYPSPGTHDITRDVPEE